MIHHETITGRLAPEDGGEEGRFDVIESGGAFKIYNGSFMLAERNTLNQAIKEAERHAAQYDRERREEIRAEEAKERRKEIARTRQLRGGGFEFRDIRARFHRNGVMGAGFTALSFRCRVRGCGRSFREMIATVFDEPGCVAVVEPANVRNCWRGDDFEPLLREAVKAFDESGELFDHSGADNV
jgi:hypothetical protein